MANSERSHWDEDPDFPVADWKHEVAEDGTRLGYHEWVANERAIRAEEEPVEPES